MARLLIREAHTGEFREIGDGALPYFLNMGWVVVDTIDDSTDSPPLYLSKEEGDARWLKLNTLNDTTAPEFDIIADTVAETVATSATLRAASGAQAADSTSPMRIALANVVPTLDPVTGKVRADQLPALGGIVVSETMPVGQQVGELWAVPTSYDPTPLGFDGMWWASRIAGAGVALPAEGSLVASMTDLTGAGAAAVQADPAKQPTLRRTAPAFGYRPVVEFDPARLTNMQTTPLWTAANQPSTIVVVGSIGADSQYLIDGIVNYTRKIGRTTTRRWIAQGSGSTNIQTPSNVADALPHLFIVEFNGATSSIEVDGVAQTLSVGGTTGDAGAQQSRALTFGSTYTPSGFVNGALAFVGRANRLLTTAEKNNLRQGFRSYYGLTAIPAA